MRHMWLQDLEAHICIYIYTDISHMENRGDVKYFDASNDYWQFKTQSTTSKLSNSFSHTRFEAAAWNSFQPSLSFA